MSYTNEQVAHLVEGSLDWETTFRMLSMPKDNSRFEQYVEALQAKVTSRTASCCRWPAHVHRAVGQDQAVGHQVRLRPRVLRLQGKLEAVRERSTCATPKKR
jgi:hypothetical protein